MDRVEEKLRETLREVSVEVGTPTPLSPSRSHQILRLRITYSSLGAFLLAGAIGGALWGLSLRANPPVPVAPVSHQRIYVIDSAPQGNATKGKVVAVDVSSTGASIVGHYPVGSDPDAALSPDGRRLYSVSFIWVSHHEARGTLQVFDTATERLLNRVPLPNWHGTTGVPLGRQIVTSPDGTRVFVVVFVPMPGSKSSAGLAVYDTTTGELLPETVPLDGCASPAILSRTREDLVVVCRRNNEVRLLGLSPTGGLASEHDVALPTNNPALATAYVSEAALSPDGNTVYAVDRDGLVSIIDLQTLTIRPLQLQLPRIGAETMVVAVPQVALTSDGHELVLGLGRYPGSSIRAHALLDVDTSTWKVIGSVPTARFSAFVISKDGSEVFTIDYASRTLQRVSLPPSKGAKAIGTIATRPTALYAARSSGPY